MPILTDALKSGASSVVGAVAEKLGVDPATAQGLIDQAMLADQAEEEPTAEAEQNSATDDQSEAQPVAEDESVVGKITTMLGGTQGITDKAKQLLDQDGDGNPLNDVTGMIGKFFAKT